MIERMNRNWMLVSLGAAMAEMLAGCSSVHGPGPQSGHYDAAVRALQSVRTNCAPDPRLAIFNVGISNEGRSLWLTGEVDRAEAKLEAVRAVAGTGAQVTDMIRVLPSAELGSREWGIVCLSVASGRLQPEHKAEMGTQMLMGNAVRLWKQSGNWFYAQSADGYLAWLEKGVFVRRTREEVDGWERAPRLIVTALEDVVLARPEAGAEPVSDVVVGDLLEKTGAEENWYRVALADGRAGFLPKKSAEDYRAWKRTREATPEGIECTARMFLGRPYLWGGVSPKGLDCSGFTKLVFFMNGIDLNRDASEQAHQGHEVALDGDLSQLKKGDLIFFGRGFPGQPERIVHAGIYLGDKLFIHSSERVQISSLDADSPIRDVRLIRTLRRARRVLPE